MSEIEPALTPEEWADGPQVDVRTGGVIYRFMWSSECYLGQVYVRQPGVAIGHGEYDIIAPKPPGMVSGIGIDRSHAIAALCLHGQPYGFTWEDVDALREAADYIRRAHAGEGDYYRRTAGHGIDDVAHPDYGDDSPVGPEGSELATALASLADRIAALLPPREPKP